MATDTESFNRDLYDLLKVRGYKPVSLDSRNQRVSASQDADVIEFQFSKDGKDYGKVWITVDDAQNIIIYYDSEQQESPSTKTPGVDYDDTWTGLLKALKSWAQRRQMGFELANKDRLGDDMRQREYYKMKEKLGESWNPMGKTASYNDAVPSVKIIVKHNRSLEEGEARYRNVARIFLENQDGERFLAPTTRPGIAQVYARHLAEGGVPNDERWNHIKSMCEDYNKMAGFVRATRNGQFNESAQELVNEGINHYQSLRETLSKLRGHKGYQAYFESWTPTLMEGEGEDISEMFMSQSLDPRIENAMPILSRLKKPVTEMEEVDTLAEWADSIISEKLELDEEKFIVSAAPGHNPTEFRAKTRDEAVELASQKWGIPAEQITVHGSGKRGYSATPNQIPEPEGKPTGGTALDKATAKAKKPVDPWYKPLANPDDLWSIGKLAIGVAEGDVFPFKKKHKGDIDWLPGDEDDFSRGEDDDDDSWIPSIEDFEQEEEIRNRKRGPANDVNEMGGDQHYSDTKGAWDLKAGKGKPIKVKDFAKKALKSLNRGMKGWEKGMHDVDTVKAATKSLSPDQKEKALSAKVGKGSPAELQQKLIKREKNKQVEEDLGPEQKRVGQLGPTEKVKNNNIGKLVGASESKEMDPELARIIEMAKFKR